MSSDAAQAQTPERTYEDTEIQVQGTRFFDSDLGKRMQWVFRGLAFAGWCWAAGKIGLKAFSSGGEGFSQFFKQLLIPTVAAVLISNLEWVIIFLKWGTSVAGEVLGWFGDLLTDTPTPSD